MADRKTKYGVNQFINEVSIESLGETDILKSLKHKYVVEFAEGESHNGNGYQFMKIYTDGELEIIRNGNWKISPIVKMPFNWTGFWVDIEISDSDNAIVSINHKPDEATQPGKKSFMPDIKYVFEKINELLLVEDKEHLMYYAKLKKRQEELLLIKMYGKKDQFHLNTLAKVLISSKIALKNMIKLRIALNLNLLNI